ncbi:hypothetical protein ACFL4T_12110, partial [candidate division KSB1 bacterium]
SLYYHLRFDNPNKPYVKIFSNWRLFAKVYFLSGLNSGDKKDNIYGFDLHVKEAKKFIEIKITANSSIWGKVEYFFLCREDYFEYYYVVNGSGKLNELFYFGSYDINGNFQGSVHNFPLVFSPEPNYIDRRYYKSWESTSIDMISDDERKINHWMFAPPPLCYSIKFTRRNWISASLIPGKGEYNFLEYKYNGGKGFSFSLTYNDNYHINGRFETPHLVFSFKNQDEYLALNRHVELYKNLRTESVEKKEPFTWWTAPIFCGWGEQVVQALLDNGKPQDYADRKFYDKMLKTLEENDIDPGIVIIDDKWQKNYGLNDVDTNKWSDLRGFIDKQHTIGRKVLLWYPLWLCEGVPESACLKKEGKAVAVDVTHPDFEKRIEKICHNLLSEDKGCMNADGFKVDFNEHFPKDRDLEIYGNIYGMEMLKKFLETIYLNSKRIKNDALIITQNPNPYYADVTDMIRLNDIHPGTRKVFSVMEHRQKVAKTAIPGILIDTDNWSGPSLKEWRNYMKKQAVLGVPSLYFVTRVDGTLEKFSKKDYRLIKRIWTRYKKLG